MKRIICILLLFIFYQGACYAQQHHDGHDKIEQLRVTFITKKLELTPVENEKFWPVYNDYTSKQRALRRNLRQSFRNKMNNLTDADAEELYQLDLQTKQAD